MRWIEIANGVIQNEIFYREHTVFWCGGNRFYLEWHDTTKIDKEGGYFFRSDNWEKAIQEANVLHNEERGEEWTMDNGIRRFYEYHL